ncbi:type II toxin-antitoxin system RelB/DinJ family antitoxin [Oxalobacter aliiformigenes]|uniref:type II toxin-antitoxin system RelB/DinJ family antitoxin n=1 Tax=Oxalobacter aliiformigenes TaxID=2946593 RepID=UPI0022AEAB51|nr:type II toxin-antitoxin system RelB/DinJ family antitoxin [Oxalobacter aliiformigenes]WAV99493.1 type II toxin-antitoxin system RelB/DinJ family antitoxin [Oxalobacter aliiformigenes]
MAQTTISVRMDDKLKQQFDYVCNELGLSMSTAITMLAKKMAREKEIPFDVSMDPFFSHSNMSALNESIGQMRGGKTVTRTLDELDALADE